MITEDDRKPVMRTLNVEWPIKSTKYFNDEIKQKKHSEPGLFYIAYSGVTAKTWSFSEEPQTDIRILLNQAPLPYLLNG